MINALQPYNIHDIKKEALILKMPFYATTKPAVKAVVLCTEVKYYIRVPCKYCNQNLQTGKDDKTDTICRIPTRNRPAFAINQKFMCVAEAARSNFQVSVVSIML